MSYTDLLTYKTAVIISLYNDAFCKKYVTYESNKSYRTYDQMTQADRSGKQNIVEGSAQPTSEKGELKLLGVARASYEELQEDYLDFLRKRGLRVWDKDSSQALAIRALAYRSNRSYSTYSSYLSDPEAAANVAICLIKQETYLLDRQIRSAEKKFVEEGGYTEKLFQKRLQYRTNSSN